ncbi:MAG: VaFE repeat-containing surface-anchored protein [Hornefia sp.]|nr:VaFE repeat-containing surface-anchored protein [Hornefia sp.]
MKNNSKIRKYISMIVAFVMVLTPLLSFGESLSPNVFKKAASLSSASRITVTSAARSKDGGVGAGSGNSQFSGKGMGKSFTGVCADTYANPPSVGMNMKFGKLSNNSTLGKIAYWCYKNPSNTYWGHHAASQIHTGRVSNTHPKVKSTIASAKKLSVPSYFEAYISYSGAGVQDVLFWHMGTPTGKAKLKKTTTNKDSLKLNTYTFKGITYGLYKSDKKAKVGTFTLKATGESNVIDDLKVGTYYAKETFVGNSNYKKDTSWHKIVVKAGKTSTITVSDIPETGNFKLKKVLKEGSEGTVADHTFVLTNLKNSKITKQGTTGANGELNIPGILLGKYRVTEKVKPGYQSLTKPQIIEIKQGVTTEIKWENNKPSNLRLQIMKTTDDGGDVAGFKFHIVGKLKNSKELTEAKLIERAKPQVTFKKYENKYEKVTPFTANKDELAKINADAKNYKKGSYTVTLTSTAKAKEGATDDTGQPLKDITISIPVKIDLQDSTEKEVKAEAKSVDIESKVTVSFNDIDFSGSATIFDVTKSTDWKGIIEFKDEDILAGEYTVTEVMTDMQKARYHQPESQTKVIDKDVSDFVFRFENKAKRTPVALEKFSPDGNIAGIKFKITGTTDFGEAVNIETETNAEGKIEFGELYAGTYILEEIGFDKTKYLNRYKLPGYDNPAIKFKITGEENETVYLGGKVGTGGENTKFINMPIPKIKTTAIDSETGDHFAVADKDISIIDTVSYQGLMPGESYEVKGTLMNQETKKPMRDDKGNVITAKTSFVPEGSNGSVDVTFKFSGVNLRGKTTVAFEELYHEGKKVAVHADIEDKDQTVDFPKLKTKLLDPKTGDNVINADSHNIVVDTVKYEKLKPGEEYEATAVLIDKKTGKQIKGVAGHTTFTAKRNGEFKVVIHFDGIKNAEKDLVCFESVRLKGKLAAVHNDINSKAQTVHVNDIGKIIISDKDDFNSFGVNTGDNNHILFMVMIFLSAICVLIYVVIHNKKEDEEE